MHSEAKRSVVPINIGTLDSKSKFKRFQITLLKTTTTDLASQDDDQQCGISASKANMKECNKMGDDFCTWVLPKWKDELVGSTARGAMEHATRKREDAESHYRQTGVVVNV